MARYAIGHQDFKGIVSEGYVYADKTMFISKLLEGSKYYFLARPRRFGKSLFLSTLEYFFLGEKDLFKNLAIGSYNWDWLEYPVIHLDLNGSNYTDKKSSLETKLGNLLQEVEDRYGLENNNEDISARFDGLIKKLAEKYNRQVVVLVDEYEKPVIDAIDDKCLSDKYREALRGFYSVLKSDDKYLKLVFLTGVTKFGQMSVFSALNNIKDISLDERFSSICGITESELLTYFNEGIKDFARKHRIDYDQAVRILKENYDGYHFSESCPDIYNPYSLLNALDSLKIESYWASSGTPTLLVQCLQRRRYNLDKLNGVTASTKRLQNLNEQLDDPVTLFYQTGYLTIKGYEEEFQQYVLGYPNREVEQSFFEFLLPYYSNMPSIEVESVTDAFKRAINHGDPTAAMREFESFSASISYDIIPVSNVERHFQSMLLMFTSLVVSRNVKVIPEHKTSDGRIDLVIETPKFVYIIEIKRDQSPEKALEQIKDKNYALPYISGGREVFLIGMNFSSESRRIEGYRIEPLQDIIGNFGNS